MGTLSIWHWAILLLLWQLASAITVVPVWLILRRLGIPGWLSLLSVIPIVGLVALWVMAFSTWPKDTTNKPSGS